MTQIIERRGDFKPDLLTEELVAAVPALVVSVVNTFTGEIEAIARFTLSYDSNGRALRVAFPDDVKAAAIESVLDEHDPDKKSKKEKKDEKLEQDRQKVLTVLQTLFGTSVPIVLAVLEEESKKGVQQATLPIVRE